MARIVIGSDHGGFAMKQALVAWLTTRGETVVDLGPVRLDLEDDYPVIASAVANQIHQDPTLLGILLCRSGQGVTIVANKFPGVRAILAWNQAVAVAGRRDDAANILALPADYVTSHEAEKIVGAWLAAVPNNADPYSRRLREIRRIEEQLGLRSSR
jgi:ribose 5-phosphate isomerase B